MKETNTGRRGLSTGRAIRRIAVFFIALLLIEIATGYLSERYLPTVDETTRLPRGVEEEALPRLIEAIHRADDGGAARSGVRPGPVVIGFLGSSPTWGHRITDPASTVPASAARALASRCVCAECPRIKAFNLASVGQLMSDRYFLSASVARELDVLAVQVDYHRLSRMADERPGIRLAGLPRLTGVSVTPEDARLTDLPMTPSPDIEGPVIRWLSRISALYRHGGELMTLALGGRNLRSYLPGAPDPEDEEVLTGGSGDRSFVDLDPALQGMVLSRYAEMADVRIPADSPELYFLRKLVAEARRNGTRVLIYMNPLNLEPLTDEDLISESRYRSVSVQVGEVVRSAGGAFADFNDSKATPAFDAGDFFDISHLTSQASRRFGAALASEIMNRGLMNRHSASGDDRTGRMMSDGRSPAGTETKGARAECGASE